MHGLRILRLSERTQIDTYVAVHFPACYDAQQRRLSIEYVNLGLWRESPFAGHHPPEKHTVYLSRAMLIWCDVSILNGGGAKGFGTIDMNDLEQIGGVDWVVGSFQQGVEFDEIAVASKYRLLVLPTDLMTSHALHPVATNVSSGIAIADMMLSDPSTYPMLDVETLLPH
jgi:hypothetical protein